MIQTPVWYVLARDILTAEPRMFRMDRIARPRLLRDVHFRPNYQLLREQLPEHERWIPLLRS